MHLTLRQLQVFESAARHLSFSRAAKELHLSQPGVSMQIKQLEESLGRPLFEQLGKRIFLTEVGRLGEAVELLRYKQEGWVPERDLVLALTADEEGGAAPPTLPLFLGVTMVEKVWVRPSGRVMVKAECPEKLQQQISFFLERDGIRAS